MSGVLLWAALAIPVVMTATWVISLVLAGCFDRRPGVGIGLRGRRLDVVRGGRGALLA